MMQEKTNHEVYDSFPLKVRVLIRIMVWQMFILNRWLKPLNMTPGFDISAVPPKMPNLSLVEEEGPLQ